MDETYTAEQLREEALSIEREGRDADEVDSKWLIGLLRAHADALEENARLRADNDTLRGLLGNSALPCPYCGLAAEDQSKCARGFPGCARADDQMLSKHFADGYRAERAEAELAKLRQAIELAARAMHGEGVDDQAQAWDVCLRILDAARADFPEEK